MPKKTVYGKNPKMSSSFVGCWFILEIQLKQVMEKELC